MKFALITYDDQGSYTSSRNEDDLLIDFLSNKGIVIEKVIWNKPDVNWTNYDFLLLKSPWDYFNLIEDFNKWLRHLKESNIKVLNPVSTVLWNSDKHYLLDIEESGLKIVCSYFLEKGSQINLEDFFDLFNRDRIIVKPAVSGGSKNTFKVNRDNVKEINDYLQQLISEEAFIVQPFYNEIVEQGEWSFVFFGGEFSHALLKTAKAGDFRVQHSFGGSIHPQYPDQQQILVAKKYVEQFAKGCLYARVDGIFVNDEFLLMELELIEPFLFLESNERSFENYYQALLKATAVGTSDIIA